MFVIEFFPLLSTFWQFVQGKLSIGDNRDLTAQTSERAEGEKANWAAELI